MMSIFCPAADAVNSGRRFNAFNILTLKVTMLTALLHLSRNEIFSRVTTHQSQIFVFGYPML